MSDSETAYLELQGVGRSFPGAGQVVGGVSLAVEGGTATAIIGPNGAGKTTLIRIAAGLLEPTDGRIVLAGEPMETWSRREIARRVSVLRQAPPQVFDFTALELVLMGFHARTGRFSLPSEQERERALEAMESLEIGHLADRPATALSGGELQRALMARTVVSDTDLWLLDEPTAHLDPRHRIALLERVRMHVDQGGGALCALHDLSLVHRFFDEVVVIGAGEMRARGPVDQTMEAGLLSEVFGVEMQCGEVSGQTVWMPRGSYGGDV